MNVTNILETVHYVVDHSGQRTSVILDLESWETLLRFIEERIEDSNLAELMNVVKDDDTLTGEEALSAYQALIVKAS